MKLFLKRRSYDERTTIEYKVWAHVLCLQALQNPSKNPKGWRMAYRWNTDRM